MYKDLLKKYLHHKCSPEELILVRRFLDQPGSSDLLQQVLDEEWLAFEQPMADEEVGRSYRKRFIAERNELLFSENIKPVKNYQWLKYAAVFMLAIGFGYYTFLKRNNDKLVKVAVLTKYNPNGQRSTITLPDSSIIYLGAGSKIKFPETFTGNTREVELEGEAFFQVKKDHKHPFIIHTGTIQTMVLGTSFKIEAFKDRLLSVSVATGKVRVDQTEALPARHLTPLGVLTPGQKITWNSITKTTSSLTISIADLEQWKLGNLTFNGERMDEVASALERYYNVNIKIYGKKINPYRVNTSFNANEPLDKVLRVLSATANFSYTIQGKYITIKRK